jgi:hypothetical protein
MKLFIAAFAMAAALSASGPQIPKSAVESEPGTFHYTDAHGKKWIYRTTPFGVARFEDVPLSKPVAAPDLTAGITATADGDTIRFERPGPFGVYKWQKAKSDLNDEERAVWNRTQAGGPSKQAGGPSKQAGGPSK